MDKNTQLINSNNECRWFQGSPLALCNIGLYKSSVSGELFAKVKLMNVQPEQISEITIDIICYGIIRNEISRIKDYTINNLKISRNECFENSELININNKDTMTIDILLKSVTALGGETWTNEENVMFDIPLKQNNIFSYMGRYIEKLRTEWSEKELDNKRLLYAPIIEENYWVCTCGTLNWGIEDSCCECGVDLSWLAEATDVSLIRQNEKMIKSQHTKSESDRTISTESENADIIYQQKQQQDLEYERKNAIKHKNKKKATVFTAFTLSLLILVAFALGIYYIIIPANNYYSAVALIDEGKYDKAIEELEKLNGYGESTEQINRAKYLKAEAFGQSANYLKASQVFKQLGNYKNSTEKYHEMMYKYGEVQFNTKEYISSLEIFTNLKDYNNSTDKANESEQAAFKVAEKLLGEKKYAQASEYFLKIANITKNQKAIEKSNLSLRHQADKLYNNYKYVEAIKIYESISGYDHIDSTLKKLDNLMKILSTSIHIGDDNSIWESVGLPCSYCHSPDTLKYSFYFKSNGTYEFDMYCSNHSGNTINKVLKGQYKIEDDIIYNLEHNGGDTKWVKLATIENISSDKSVANKNAKMVVTNPFAAKSKKTLILFGNLVDENSSPI